MTITAKIIADSISEMSNDRITTFELEYPRFIHSEFMTHRALSKNAASSRAIPVEKAIDLILENTAYPVFWGKNQPGMKANEECSELIGWSEKLTREEAWRLARDCSIAISRAYSKAGYHKQIVNRISETYSYIKVICTGTQYANFFALRTHPNAQPEFQKLASLMRSEMKASVPRSLKKGEWHVPYFSDGYWNEGSEGTLEDALAISASCCAQVSYRKNDESLEKAKAISEKLLSDRPIHASPFEHQATPIPYFFDEIGEASHLWEVGITHQDRYNSAWSGNFKGWIQHRQLIPDNNVETFYI